ncbi:MAG TPA: hypothetical protein VGI40_06980 [Pirellulaceae bacterium]|jgi:hypothetical protein
MSFTDVERKRIGELADVLIPAADGHLSASQADVASRGLNLYLQTCPEMAAGLRQVLQKTGNAAAAAAVETLRTRDPATFGTLAEFAAGAYFLNPQVRDAIGYAGQTPHPIDPTPDYLNDGLLESVIQRGPIFRPTPSTKP